MKCFEYRLQCTIQLQLRRTLVLSAHYAAIVQSCYFLIDKTGQQYYTLRLYILINALLMIEQDVPVCDATAVQ